MQSFVSFLKSEVTLEPAIIRRLTQFHSTKERFAQRARFPYSCKFSFAVFALDKKLNLLMATENGLLNMENICSMTERDLFRSMYCILAKRGRRRSLCQLQVQKVW